MQPDAAGQNRRVEIVISGDPIGTLANWEKPYSVAASTLKMGRDLLGRRESVAACVVVLVPMAQ